MDIRSHEKEDFLDEGVIEYQTLENKIKFVGPPKCLTQEGEASIEWRDLCCKWTGPVDKGCFNGEGIFALTNLREEDFCMPLRLSGKFESISDDELKDLRNDVINHQFKDLYEKRATEDLKRANESAMKLDWFPIPEKFINKNAVWKTDGGWGKG